MEIFYGLLACVCLTMATALPTKAGDEATIAARSSNVASEASQIIATNLLKSYIDIDGNQVHSPLGVTSMLAILAEGAAGATYDEFNKVFGYPKERSNLSASFKRILARYQNREYQAEPSFQTWLYIYRNFSAREEFKQLVRDYYFVEVKDINRDEYDWNAQDTSLDSESTTTGNSKDVIGFETLKRINVDDDDIGLYTSSFKDTYGEEVLAKAASKFDRFVDDKQYVEKPSIIDEIKKEQDKMDEVKRTIAEPTEILAKPTVEIKDIKSNDGAEIVVQKVEEIKKPEENPDAQEKNKREDDFNLEENETVQAAEKMHKNYEEPHEKLMVPIQEVLASNEPEKVSIPLQKLESAVEAASKGAAEEIMLALESHISSVRRVFGARSLFRKDDITSALSANSITGREIGSKTKMLLFNGLYYRGNWAIPFFEKPGAIDYFFMTAEDAMKTPMLHAKGTYMIADMEHLNAKALCLPYANKKYAMIVMVPNEFDGLHSVIEKMQPSDFKYFKTNAQEKELHISLPKFQVDETTRSKSTLMGLGLQKIFSRDEADLSLLADDRDLYVDEIVQFVSIRVDEGGSSENALSATTTEARTSDSKAEIIEINRPFLYFIMDCEEDFVIASGKVYAPEIKDEQPVSIEVEFEQA